MIIERFSLGVFTHQKSIKIYSLVNINLGKAYIDFETQEDAEKAISYMHNVRK
jgi:RNA recognition motif-containing protein